MLSLLLRRILMRRKGGNSSQIIFMENLVAKDGYGIFGGLQHELVEIGCGLRWLALGFGLLVVSAWFGSRVGRKAMCSLQFGVRLDGSSME
ncbi:hypothetical protein L1987_30401 [Smallanthus sonchifolius]|uniref:Uncharacterized protein n=1 Tax=Smallanthus sonchifolius TaxID=185202 RepID=A0ACB9I477_9ASTR|nr:hypothetical protein L1987_30401 [Smallanthus sonchifolius]